MQSKPKTQANRPAPSRKREPVQTNELAPNDLKALVRLANKYGPESITDALRSLRWTPVSVRDPFEDAAFAGMIEEWRKELHDETKKPVTLKMVLAEACLRRWGKDQPRGNSGMELLKKQYQRGLPIYKYQLAKAKAFRGK